MSPRGPVGLEGTVLEINKVALVAGFRRPFGVDHHRHLVDAGKRRRRQGRLRCRRRRDIATSDVSIAGGMPTALVCAREGDSV